MDGVVEHRIFEIQRSIFKSSWSKWSRAGKLLIIVQTEANILRMITHRFAVLFDLRSCLTVSM